MSDDGDRRLSEEAQDLDDHLRGLVSDLGPQNVRKKRKKKEKRRPWKVTLLFLILLLAAIGILLAVIFKPDLLNSQSEPLNASGTESTVTDPTSTPSTPVTEILESSDANVLSGTWAMYWTNANGDEGQAFTIRFDGVDQGTVEILNDDTEFDTTFRLDGDGVWFTFTRVFDIEITGSPTVKWPEISIFEGSFDGLDEISGEWAREDWDCSPDRDPPCKYRSDAIGNPARLVRE